VGVVTGYWTLQSLEFEVREENRRTQKSENIKYQVSNIQYPTSKIKHPVTSIQHPVSSTG
jgi:hypothetical protein